MVERMYERAGDHTRIEQRAYIRVVGGSSTAKLRFSVRTSDILYWIECEAVAQEHPANNQAHLHHFGNVTDTDQPVQRVHHDAAAQKRAH